jgi:hypothetical protein
VAGKNMTPEAGFGKRSESGRRFAAGSAERKRLGIVLFNNGDDAMATSTHALRSNTLQDAFDIPSAPVAARTAQVRKLPKETARRAAQPNYIPRPSLLNRLFAALVLMRQRQAEQEIARYLATTGGKLTDGIEREILRRLG